jgi:hypothetical protein
VRAAAWLKVLTGFSRLFRRAAKWGRQRRTPSLVQSQALFG